MRYTKLFVFVLAALPLIAQDKQDQSSKTPTQTTQNFNNPPATAGDSNFYP